MNDYHRSNCERHAVLERQAMRRTRVRLQGADECDVWLDLSGVVSDVARRHLPSVIRLHVCQKWCQLRGITVVERCRVHNAPTIH